MWWRFNKLHIVAAVTFPPLPQLKLVLDLATLEVCKAELTWVVVISQDNSPTSDFSRIIQDWVDLDEWFAVYVEPNTTYDVSIRWFTDQVEGELTSWTVHTPPSSSSSSHGDIEPHHTTSKSYVNASLLVAHAVIRISECIDIYSMLTSYWAPDFWKILRLS